MNAPTKRDVKGKMFQVQIMRKLIHPQGMGSVGCSKLIEELSGAI